MTNKFYSTPTNSDTDSVIDELFERNYTELEPSGDGNIFIDTVNKTFWICSPEALASNTNMVEQLHQEKVYQTNLNEIKSWEN
jgi:hypothetical protein